MIGWLFGGVAVIFGISWFESLVLFLMGWDGTR